MLSWLASSHVGVPACEEMHVLQSNPPARQECPYREFLQSWFWKQLEGSETKKYFLAPSRWTCLPYVLLQSEQALLKGLTTNQRDPLSVFAGKRDVLRKDKRKSLLLQEQTKMNLPDTPNAIVHLEAQGYLCVHCTFSKDRIKYWYENPQNSWVAYLAFDARTGKMIDKRVETGNPAFYHFFTKEGVTT